MKGDDKMDKTQKDPFYSEENMARLKKAVVDANAGVHMAEHELVDLPNEVTAAAIAEADEIAKDPSIKGYTNMEDLKAALEIQKDF